MDDLMTQMIVIVMVGTILLGGLFYAIRKEIKSGEEWELEKMERRHQKKLKAQKQYEAIISISESLRELASRGNTSRTSKTD